jgi:hypothetical protein
MTRRLPLLIFTVTLATLVLPASRGPSAPIAPASQAGNRPLTPEEIHALVDRVIAAQHRDDALLNTYERIERHVARTGGGADSHVTKDKTYRVVPTGSGTLKLLIKESEKPVSQETYLRQLRTWQEILAIAVNPDDPREKGSEEKQQKKMKDRAEFVEAARGAYHISWSGRETRDGRAYAKLLLEPNPQFRPKSRSEDILTHARARIWIDELSGHLARIEADIIRDISFGGGILGKVYRGGHFSMEQSEVTPGVWLPRRYQQDFVGRKLFFGFEIHETTEISRYQKIGGPKEALAIVRQDIQSGRGIPGDP